MLRSNGFRAVRRWVIPWLASRLHGEEFRPLLCCLYTDWRCKIDCRYCFQYDDDRPWMTLETARSSIDWLKTLGYRVLAIMGGGPPVRKDFILKAIHDGSRNGSTAINLAVDTLLDWLIEKQRQGWCMVNPVAHLQTMKNRMRVTMRPWHCRAGHKGASIRPDGSLAPCFNLIDYDHDWETHLGSLFRGRGARSDQGVVYPYFSAHVSPIVTSTSTETMAR